MVQKVFVVVGGQFGSEGKGHVTAQLVKQFHDSGEEVTNVRVAGPNAGHTVVDEEGRSFALRQVPVGAVYSTATLVIAPGSEVDPEVLEQELHLLTHCGHDLAGRFFLSKHATLLSPQHKVQEEQSDLVKRLGSTAKGIGAARAARVWRTAKTVYESDLVHKLVRNYGLQWGEPENLYAAGYVGLRRNSAVVVEGTQGYGLGVHTENYPQTTSSDCRAVDFLAMAGLTPRLGTDFFPVVVARPNPIRVAGNSGELKGESTWDELGQEVERTTVTQKVRRVGEWDLELLQQAVVANGGPAKLDRDKGFHHLGSQVTLALTMVDKKFAGNEGVTDVTKLTPEALEWVKEVEEQTGCAVLLVTTSPSHAAWSQDVAFNPPHPIELNFDPEFDEVGEPGAEPTA